MEVWITYTFAAIILWTIVELIDKFVVDFEIHDPIVATVICGITTFLIFQMFALMFGNFSGLDLKIILISIFVGVLYNLSTWFYYIGVQKEDLSTFIPLLSISPLFVVPLAYVFFDEVFSKLTYFGIVLIVIGAILISFKKASKSKLSSALIFASYIAVLYAIRSVLIKYATTLADLWALMFWIGFGGIIVSLFMYIVHTRKVEHGISKKGILHLLISGLFTALGFLAGFFAIAKGPVTLVSALFNAQPLLVFFSVIVLGALYPNVILERMDKQTMFKKFIAIVLITVGALLII